MKKVFRLEKLFEDITENYGSLQKYFQTHCNQLVSNFWWFGLDGVEVVDGYIDFFYIPPEWCEEIPGEASRSTF